MAVQTGRLAWSLKFLRSRPVFREFCVLTWWLPVRGGGGCMLCTLVVYFVVYAELFVVTRGPVSVLLTRLSLPVFL